MFHSPIRSSLYLISLGYCLECSAEQDAVQSEHSLSAMSAWHSLLALILVLGLFFVCVWVFRQLNMASGQANNAKMQVIGGISLGFREKIVLVQVGAKQLVLAVTPGRIETLTILEGDECLQDLNKSLFLTKGSDFSQKLMQAMKGRMHG